MTHSKNFYIFSHLLLTFPEFFQKYGYCFTASALSRTAVLHAQRRGDLATRRISGERFLIPDTTPMAIYSVRTEDPP